MTVEYIDVQVNVSDEQKEKIRNAVKSGSNVSIRLSHKDFDGEDVLGLTRAQIKRMEEAYKRNKGIVIKMSKAQLRHNMSIEGGFLPAILGFLGSTVAPFLLKTALPALATGALSSLASVGVSKALGSGVFYIKKGGRVYKASTQGEGLWLRPYTGAKMISGDGIFLKTGSGFVDGRGLILGQDNPVSQALSNIPLLGPLLSMIL